MAIFPVHPSPVIASCDQEVANNITYIVSPNFPGVMSRDVKSCKLKIKMIDDGISQLRFDFIHFQLGQPNRWTGICEGDLFSVSSGTGGQGDFKICGQNSGQHIYYDLESLIKPSTGRQSSDPPLVERAIDILLNLTESVFLPRLWEIRVAQIPFSQRAPAGCLQYFTGGEGLIQTFNYAENGRHLANQNYRACIRQETGMCSIAYEPCNPFSFRIGQRQMYYGGYPGYPGGAGGGGGFPGGFAGGPGGFGPGGVPLGMVNSAPPGSGGVLSDSVATDAATNGAAADSVPAADGGGGDGLPGDGAASPADGAADDASDGVANDEVDENAADDGEGSGGGGFFSSLSSLFSFRGWRSLEERQSRQFFPYCWDRITLPCIVEDFIGSSAVSMCQPVHCGSSLCPPGQTPCRVETSVTPFGIGFHFGDGVNKGSPEENIGACLRWIQMPCL
ncbi:uncharacterized protein DMENIID0001_085650 [Sergentomyia squamirostris]